MNVMLIDVGNSRIKFGRASGAGVKAAGSVSTDTWLTGRRLSLPPRLGDVKGVVVWVASVVPDVNATLERWLSQRGAASVHFVDHRQPWSFQLDYPKPETLGADRLANAEGAMTIAKPPLVVVSIGTAVTMDVVTRDSRFIGGIIAPGPALWLDYLADRTAKLPRIDATPTNRGRVGRSTKQAMQLATAWGFPAMLTGIIQKLMRLDPAARWTILATGGYLNWMPAVPRLHRVPELALAGLCHIASHSTEV